MKMVRVKSPIDMTIGQMYLYKKGYSNTLCRGRCVKITEATAVMRHAGYGGDDDIYMGEHIEEKTRDKVWVYNGSHYHKYKRMMERHERELEGFLKGDYKDPDNERWRKRLQKGGLLKLFRRK